MRTRIVRLYFVIGATGPMDEGKRRPRVDWDHTANVQGTVIRDYVKWDYQPGGVAGIPDSFARAWSVMMTEPQGPIYMCYDAGIQEAPLTENIRLPDAASAKRPSRMAPEMVSLGEIADRLIAAEWPVLLPQYVGRVPGGFGDMVALAETTGAAVSDVQSRLNFPTEHPLDCRMNREVFKTADVILALDCRDWERPTHYNDRVNRTLRAHYPDHCQWMDIGFADIEISKWAMGYQKFPECAVRVLADTALAIPALTQLCRERVTKDKRAAARHSGARRRNPENPRPRPCPLARRGKRSLGHVAHFTPASRDGSMGADKARRLGAYDSGV